MGVRNKDAKEGKDGQRGWGRDGENSSGRVWGRLTRTGREEGREGAALERGGRGERDGKGNKKGGE